MTPRLELDHVFCLVAEPARAAQLLKDDGWVLDAGQIHAGQGTRNRRVDLGDQFFELLWVCDATEARVNPLRLDRRADWAATGASPIGLGFRGRIDPALADEFWLYHAVGVDIWIHRDDERHPERPLIFVLDAEQRRPSADPEGRTLREVRVQSPSPPSLPDFAGPAIAWTEGPHGLDLVVGDEGSPLRVDDYVTIRR